MLEPWQVSIISSLLGVTLGGILGFAGSYLIQKRTWKRQAGQEIVKKVYEPLYQQLIRNDDDVLNFSALKSLEKFEEIESCPSYNDTPHDFRGDLVDVHQHLKKYQLLYEATEGSIDRIIRETMKEHGLLKEKEDPNISYRAFLDNKLITLISLHEGLLKGETPQELLQAKIKDLKNVNIEIAVSGYTAEQPQLVDGVCKKALEKGKKDSILEQFKIERGLLNGKLQKMLIWTYYQIKKTKKV
jgi:hypothetical protein